ncbi:integrin beta-3-like, partial [Amphibalanus amphitrite]|uniref:integrin beta-3-like n=1 Tax=Amphibalanus amphitrite TaxID=1232801 RepID=UPI001C919365
MRRPIILAAGLLALSSLFQPGGAETTASCKGQQSCTACLTAHSDCAWCKTERSEGFPYDHCDLSAVIARLCPPPDIVFPRSSVEAVKNTSLSEQQSPSQPVQVAPQHLRLKLRPHERKEFEVKFRQVADYPLDLYYLMDLTVSMREDKETLVALGEDMTILLRRLTKNFRLGFGSFVDKPVMPYVSQAAGTKENPCALYKDITCVPAYGFRNHLNLSNEVNRFTEKVRQAEVSANLDDLEGGLDALVQVATCSDVIGWNKKSRKLIIYTSDGLFHLAGEGLLGGAAMRNELACKLSDDGYYERTRTHDYPSVAELDRVLRRENMNVVFAVFSDVRKEYDKLAELMKASVQVESLLDDSSNILSVIKRQYESITSRIELVDDSGDEIAIRYRSSCLDNELKLRNNCTGIKTGDLVTFSIEVEVLGCPKQKNHTIHLKDVLTSETVRLDVEIVCECDCERPELVQTNSPKCSGVGALQCGVCDCPDGRAGWSCECSETLSGQSCLPDNSTSGPECSGRGECVCGKCECHAGSTFNITGQFCQCDSRLCD